MDSPAAQTIQQPPNPPNLNPTNNLAPNQPKPSFFKKLSSLSLTTKIAAGIAFMVFIIFIVLLFVNIFGNSNKNGQNDQSTTSTSSVEKERQRQIAASAAALKQQEPQSRLQSAYNEVVGSNSAKRTLTIDSNGVATIEYEIASTNGQLILKTSYENFADLATRVFNIPTILRLNVTTYANKFTDAYGTPNLFAVKLQITKEASAKINWSLKKYSYGDYATLLTVHELNTALSKDYKSLTKK